MNSPGINGEKKLRGQPANPGSPGKMAVKTECVCVSPTNSPKRGMNRQFQAKRAEYENRDILQSIKTINVQF